MLEQHDKLERHDKRQERRDRRLERLQRDTRTHNNELEVRDGGGCAT